MRNKFSSNLLQKGLISLAAASVLATSSFAVDGTYEGTIQDFRITTDKTTVAKGDVLNVVVEALDESGRVDVLTTDTALLKVNSILGKVVDAGADSESDGDSGRFGDTDVSVTKTKNIDFANGKAGFSIYYPSTGKIGLDTIRFTLKVEDIDDSSGASIIFPSVDKSVTITNPSNQALGLEIISMEVDDTTVAHNNDKTDYGNVQSAVSDSNGTVVAGEAFTFKIVSLSADDNTTSQESDIFETAQNSEVTLNFIGSDIEIFGNTVIDSDETNETIVHTAVGDMINGVAFIRIEAGDIQEAGEYYLQVTTPTTQTTSDDDKVAKSLDTYQLYVYPATASGLITEIQDNNVTYLYDTDNDPTDDNVTDANLTISLVDEYLNDVNLSFLPDGDAPTFTITTVDAKVAGTAYSTSALTVTVDSTYLGGKSDNGYIMAVADAPDALDTWNSTSETAEITVTVASSDLTVHTSTVALPVYGNSLTMDVNNTTTERADLTGTNLVAGTVYERFVSIPNLANQQVKVELIDEDGVVIDTSSALSIEGNVSVRFFNATSSTKGIYKVRATPAGTSSSTIIYSPTEMVINEDTNISAGVASLVQVYEAGDEGGTAISSITVDLKTFEEFNLDTNTTELTSTSVDFNTSEPKYVVLLTDEYGNVILSPESSHGEISISKVSTDATVGSDSLNLVNGEESNVTYTKIGTDTVSLGSSVPGVSALEIPVTIVDTSTSLSTIQILTGSDYLLTNGEMATVIKAFDSDGDLTAIGDTTLSILLSNPNIITVRDANRSDTIKIYEHGSFLNATDSGTDTGIIVLDLKAENTVGDLTVTIRDTSGQIQASKLVHVVSSTADIIGAVDSVTSSITSKEIEVGSSFDLTFTVTDDAGNGLANKTLQILSDNTAIISMDEIATTDENGEVTVTLTSEALGLVNVSATSDGKSSNVIIDVVAATAMTISATDATIAEAEQETITITNPAKTLTSDDITNTDDSVVTASLVDGNVVLTATAAGTATITVTDGTTTKTINVTVEAGLVTGPVSDISSLGQSAYQTELNIANKNAYVTKNADGSLTVNNKMSVAITDTEITITPTGDYAGYTVKYIELKEGTAPKLRVIEEYIQISDTQYLKVTLEEAAVVAPTTAMTPALVAGWNLLGNASNASQTVAKTGISVTWTFDGAWTQDGDVPAGQGFWAKADADIAGYEFANSGDGTSMPTFTAGTWSLMAATMSETLADVLASKTDATIVWSFTDSTWSSDDATTIEAGQGYWVK